MLQISAKEAIKLVNDSGIYQYRMILLFSLQWLLTACLFMSPPFLF